MPDLEFDFTRMGVKECYKIICGIVVPRPIALVTSVDEEGRVNAAPFSFFNAFSDDPVQIALGLQHKADGTPLVVIGFSSGWPWLAPGALLVLITAGTAQMRHGMLPSFIGDGLSMLAFAATALRASVWRRAGP